MPTRSYRFVFAATAVTAVAALLTACAQPAPAAPPAPVRVESVTVPAAPPDDGTPRAVFSPSGVVAASTVCNAAPAQLAVGKPFDAALMADAQARSGARTARALRPGQQVTMEFNSQRLNLDVDAGGKVTRVHCG